jgi:hypothetical protein
MTTTLTPAQIKRREARLRKDLKPMGYLLVKLPGLDSYVIINERPDQVDEKKTPKLCEQLNWMQSGQQIVPGSIVECHHAYLASDYLDLWEAQELAGSLILSFLDEEETGR